MSGGASSPVSRDDGPCSHLILTPGALRGAVGDDDLAEAAAAPSPVSPTALDVVWAASGEAACSVQVSAKTCMVDVKAQIFDRLGVPVPEQRLFLAGEELPADDASAVADFAAGAGAGPLRLLRCLIDPRNTDLGHFSATARLEPLACLKGELTKVRVLAKSLYGTVWLEQRQCDSSSDTGGSAGEQVAVKEMSNDLINQNAGKETNEWTVHLEKKNAPHVEDALTEIGIMTYLSKQRDLPLYILRMLGAYVDPKCTYLLTEYAEGGELFRLALSEVRFPEVQLRTYTWQLLQAVKYLHGHNIGHRDISLENILLKDGVIRLMDFGMSALVRSTSTGEQLRYFRRVGKDCYRAPECYVPDGTDVRVFTPRRLGAPRDLVMAVAEESGWLCQVRLPPGASPDKLCVAELWGYALPPVDVFAIGVCLFNLAWHSFPWAHAVPTDPYFDFVHSRGSGGVAALLSAWQKPQLSPEAMRLVSEMISSDPAERPSPDDCLSRPWFAPVARASVAVHPAATAATESQDSGKAGMADMIAPVPAQLLLGR